jgi:hypothetical protein
VEVSVNSRMPDTLLNEERKAGGEKPDRHSKKTQEAAYGRTFLPFVLLSLHQGERGDNF